MSARFDSATDLTHRTYAIESGEVTLHVETLQASEPKTDHRSVLLLSEAEAPSSRWPTELLTGLARSVGRCCWFDTRDVGASTWTEEPYTMGDLVDDALAVIEGIGAEPVDVFGRSMGGEIAMRLAISRPELVRSLLLLSTTPGRRDELGLPEDWLIEKMSGRLLEGPPTDHESRARWIVDQLEWFSGPVFEFDRDGALVRAEAEVREQWRGPNGHGAAVMEADDVVDSLRSVSHPTLVIHGTADPVLPVDHARAINTLVEHSRLALIEGLGHELPDAFIGQLLSLIGGAGNR